jgi:hypothetical protein
MSVWVMPPAEVQFKNPKYRFNIGRGIRSTLKCQPGSCSTRNAGQSGIITTVEDPIVAKDKNRGLIKKNRDPRR